MDSDAGVGGLGWTRTEDDEPDGGPGEGPRRHGRRPGQGPGPAGRAPVKAAAAGCRRSVTMLCVCVCVERERERRREGGREIKRTRAYAASSRFEGGGRAAAHVRARVQAEREYLCEHPPARPRRGGVAAAGPRHPGPRHPRPRLRSSLSSRPPPRTRIAPPRTVTRHRGSAAETRPRYSRWPPGGASAGPGGRPVTSLGPIRLAAGGPGRAPASQPESLAGPGPDLTRIMSRSAANFEPELPVGQPEGRAGLSGARRFVFRAR